MNNNHVSEYPIPMDLSRRRDSLESRKTPSPYNSSNFGSSPPSVVHDSPSTTSIASLANASSLLQSLRDRSDTPLHHFQHHQAAAAAAAAAAASGFLPYPPMLYPFAPKRDTPSPVSDDAIQSQLRHHFNPDPFNQQFLYAVAMAQQPYDAASVAAVTQSPKMVIRSDSDESSESMTNLVHAMSPTAPSKPQSPSSSSNSSTYPMIINRDGKLARPFKAYPRNPLSVSASFAHTDPIIDRNSTEKYQEFRKEMLGQIHAANGGHPTVSNPRMRRTSNKSFADSVDQKHQQMDKQNNNSIDDANSMDSSESPMPQHGPMKDSSYYERRKKNNAAAKKSRDRRRIKEDEIAIRAAFLERENIELKCELASVRRQLTDLQNKLKT